MSLCVYIYAVCTRPDVGLGLSRETLRDREVTVEAIHRPVTTNSHLTPPEVAPSMPDDPYGIRISAEIDRIRN